MAGTGAVNKDTLYGVHRQTKAHGRMSPRLIVSKRPGLVEAGGKPGDLSPIERALSPVGLRGAH